MKMRSVTADRGVDQCFELFCVPKRLGNRRCVDVSIVRLFRTFVRTYGAALLCATYVVRKTLSCTCVRCDWKIFVSSSLILVRDLPIAVREILY